MADVSQEEDGTAPVARRPDMMIPIERIHPNPEQPRRSFTTDQLEELAASIKEKGVIQPLIVRPRPDHEGEFEIVAGERRWRASQMAHLHEIPVLVREFDDTEVLEVAIIENIQRADLNPVEEATGYKQLMEKFGHTQEKLSDVLGKSRSHIANLVRLLSLPEDVQTFLRDDKLTAGHARALITADDPSTLARQVIQKGLSVRETEKLAKKPTTSTSSERAQTTAKPKREKDADTKALEEDLQAGLGMNVVISHDTGQETGRITISYSSLDQLDDLCMRLTR
jgi:ParB family chromosome partitioning protein